MKYDQKAEAPRGNKLIGLIKAIFKYPFKVSGMYSGYNKGLSELIAVKNEPALKSKDDVYYRAIQKKNLKFIWGFIYFPILVGVLASALSIYTNRDKYQLYIHRLSLPVKEERFVKTVSIYFDKLIYLVRGQPISMKDLTPFLIGYLISIMGARFCSKNPTFAIQEEMQRKFTALGCTDIDGNPWRVVWTPEALLVTSFGRDPNQLYNDAKFWATINFPPSIPKQSKKDMNKFVVQRKYELSSNMVITLEGVKDET